jgi:chorismate dehydratase
MMNPAEPAPPLRIGAVSYLNARPLVYGLEHGLGSGRVVLSHDVPSRLAERMAGGELDVALLPIVELARIPGLELVPGLGIVTGGPSRSVLLLCRRPATEVRTVALDPESRTSNVLAQVLLIDAWGRRAEARAGFADVAEALRECDAAVRIGDKALFEPVPPGVEVHDLGEEWTRRTGLPFVYAAWVARAGAVDREIYRLLHASRREGCGAIDRIATEYVWRGERQPGTARAYLAENIRYRLGAPEVQAIERFLEAAARHGLIGAAPRIRMALARRTGCHEIEAAGAGRSAGEETR